MVTHQSHRLRRGLPHHISLRRGLPHHVGLWSRLHRKLAIAGVGMHRAAGLPEEKSGAHRLHGVRTHHQGDLPGFGEVTIVDFHVTDGQ